MRKVIVYLMTIVMLMGASASVVFAADDAIPVSPVERYSYVRYVTAELSITKDGIATSKMVVKEQAGETDKITATMSLQKYSGGSWKTIKTWSETTKSSLLTLSKKKNVSKGKYRVYAKATAYHGGKTETIKKYSKEKKY